MSFSSESFSTIMSLVIILTPSAANDLGKTPPLSLSPSAAAKVTYSTQWNVDFIARLIHRASPDSPFYDPNETPDDIMAENIRTSSARVQFFSRRRPEDIFALAPLSNEYSMHYSIGTPPVQTFGIPDTGSPLTWLQCEECLSCYQQSIPLFNPANSTTYRNVSCAATKCWSVPTRSCPTKYDVCTYDMHYGDGSFSFGIDSTEVLTLMNSYNGGPFALANTLFGCGINNSDTVGSNIPGIVGLGNHSISLVGRLDFGPFSLCVDWDTNTNNWIRFGSAAMLTGGRTPLLPNRFGHYHLILEGFRVGNERSVKANYFEMTNRKLETGFMIDLGTTLTYLYEIAFNRLIRDLQKYFNYPNTYSEYPYNYCINLEDMHSFPDITFHFKSSGKV